MASMIKALQEVRQTPEQILRDNFARRPLRCDEGEIRNDLASVQERHALECQLVRLVPLSEIFRSHEAHPAL